MERKLHLGDLSAIVDTNGGELVSLRDGAGTEYIWSGDPAYWSGRNPILFPIVGALKEGRVRVDGRTYQMDRHGFARKSVFRATEAGEDFVVFTLRETPETLERYPFPFVLQVRHQLLADGFQTVFTVRNTGTRSMPFCIGAHTAFRCPLGEGEAFEDYDLVFDQPEDAATLLLTPQGCFFRGQRETVLSHSDTIPLDHGIFDRLDTLTFDGLRSAGVSLRHRRTGRGVHVDFTGFPMVAFWTMPNVRAPYICIEPWHGCAAFDDEHGDFEEKRYCIRLAPGESKTLCCTVTLLQG